jgi:N-acetylmuramoyl-L-alanine amidase
MNILQKTTPNFAKGRDGQKPEIIVLHISTASISSCDSWFADPVSQVSAHYIVGFTGEIHQYVQESDTAWANGQVINPTAPYLFTKPGINPNKYSISIEHEGTDLSKAPLTQLQSSTSLIRDICGRYGIPIDETHVIGHYAIKSTKPDCPATDKSIIKKIIDMAQPADPLVNLQVPQSRLAKIQAFLLTLN